MTSGAYILIFGVAGVVGLFMWWALSVHSSRRKKFIQSVLGEEDAGSANLYLKGFDQKGAWSLAQWVFVAIGAEQIRIFAEFVTSFMRADYSLLEINRDDISNLTIKTLSKNKIFIKFAVNGIEFYLRVKPHGGTGVDAAISLLNTFKK